jgi:DNA-binding GntR family transcriptional regulator
MKAPYPDLVPGARTTAHQMVLESLRRAILEGTVEAGSRLVQADVAAQLNVSITPVREALRDLAREGLVRLEVHRGATVQKTSWDEVEEIYLIRRLLEPEAVRLGAEAMTPTTLAALEAVQAQMDTEADTVRWVQLNRDFHRTLVAASGKPRLTEVLQQLEDNATIYVNLALRASGNGPFRTGNHDHHELIGACRRHDGDAAAAHILEHLANTLAIVRQASASFGGPPPQDGEPASPEALRPL